jgi:hypothetical protein
MQIGENRKALAENEKQKTERVLSRKKDQAHVKAYLSQVVTDLNQPILSQAVGELQFLIRHCNCSPNADGSAVNVRFQNPATPQSLRPLRFQKRTFTAPIVKGFYTFSQTEFLSAF